MWPHGPLFFKTKGLQGALRTPQKRVYGVLGAIGVGSVLNGLLLLVTCPVFAQEPMVLDYEGIVDQALAQSWDVKISDVNTELSKVNQLKARLEYMPKVNMRINSERLGDLTGVGAQTGTVTVGDIVLPSSGSRYQDVMSLNVSQTVFQFGVRKRKVLMANKDVAQKEVAEIQTERDLKLKLAELYAEALVQFNAVNTKEKMLPLYQQLFQLKLRLYEAGSLSKVELAEEALLVAQTADELQGVKHKLKNALQELSFYTHQPYDVAQVTLAPFSDHQSVELIPFDETQTPEYQIYQLERERKKTELQMQKRQGLPQLSTYAYYSFYGFDPNNWGQAVGDLSDRVLSVGLSLTIPISDTVKNAADVRRVRLEMAKAELEHQKKLDEIRRQYEKSRQEYQERGEEITLKEDTVHQTQERLTMVERLSAVDLVDKTQILKEQARVLDEQRKLNEAEIRRQLTEIKMKLIVTAG